MNDDQLVALPDPIPGPLVELLAGRLRVIGDRSFSTRLGLLATQGSNHS
jgi:hypothetical protein